jgi:hypothetical protein
MQTFRMFYRWTDEDTGEGHQAFMVMDAPNLSAAVEGFEKEYSVQGAILVEVQSVEDNAHVAAYYRRLFRWANAEIDRQLERLLPNPLTLDTLQAIRREAYQKLCRIRGFEEL